MNYGLDLAGDAIRLATGAVEDPDIVTAPSPVTLDDVDGLSETLRQVLAETDASDGSNRLCVTISGSTESTPSAVEDSRRAIDRAFADDPIETVPIHPGVAVVYAELADASLTGLGIGVGTDSTNATLAYYGVPVVTATIDRGVDWVVDRAVTTTDASPESVRTALKSVELSPDLDSDGVENAIADAYDELCLALVEALGREAASSDLRDGVSLAVAVGGPGVRPGLEFLFGGRLEASELPLSIRDVGITAEPATCYVRGALSAAAEGVSEDETLFGTDLDEAEAAGDDTGRIEADAGASAREDPNQLVFEEGAIETTANPGPEDAAIEQLFDRLGAREQAVEAVRESVENVRTELEELASAHETLAAESARSERLETLESELEATLDRLESEFDASVAEVDTAVSALDETTESLTADLATTRDELERLEATVEASEATGSEERATLRASIEEITSSLSATTDDLQSIDDRVDSVVERTNELAEAMATEATLENRLAAATDAVESRLDDERSKTDDRLETIESAVAETSETLDSHQSTLQERLSSVETAIDELEADRAAVTDQLEAETAELDNRLSTVRGEFEDGLDAFEGELEAIEGHLDALEDDLADFEAEVGDGHRERAALDDEVASVADEVTSLEARLESMGTTREESTDALADELAVLRRERQETVDRVSEIAQELESLQELNAEHAHHEDRLDQLERALEDAERTLAEAPDQDDVTELESRLATLEGDLSDTVVTADEATDRTTAVATRVEGVEDTLDTIDDRLAELEPSADRAAESSVFADGPLSSRHAVPSALGAGSAGVLTGIAFLSIGEVTVGVGLLAVGVGLLGGGYAISSR